MLALQHDLTIEQQTSFLKVFQWLNSNNTPIDLTGYETELEIRDGNDKIIDTFDTTNGFCVNDSSGKMTFTVSASQVEDYIFDDRCRYSLKVFNQTGSELVEAGSWSSTSTDVNDGSGRTTVTANGGTPFSTLSSGDYIALTVTTAGTEGNSGIYKLESATNTVLTLATKVGGEDSSLSTDIGIFKLNTSKFYRLAEGKFTYSKESARVTYKHVNV